MIFIVGSFMVIALKKVRRAVKVTPFIWFSLGTVWISSVLQSMLDHGDNPRFLIPMQSLVVLIVLWGVMNLIDSRSRHAD
jgi:hypothetical protein